MKASCLKINLFLIFLILFMSQGGYAGNWYVRTGSSGNGSSWLAAWGDVTNINWASVQPGDTIWIAGGSYGALIVGKSGNSNSPSGRIFIKRATTATNASDSGYSSSFDSQVILSSVTFSTLNLGSYVTIDGQVDNGIKIPHGDGDVSSISFDRGVSYVTLRYLELAGPGDISSHYHSGDDRGIDITAWNGSSFELVDNLLVQHLNIHGACTQLWIYHADNSTFEYNDIHNSWDANGSMCHPNIIATAGTNNLNFRYNKIHDYDDEGIMFLGNGGSWYVYGNLWYSGIGYSRILETQNGVNGPVYFYNNTADGIWASVNAGTGNNGGSWDSRSTGKNNIWWNMTWTEGLPNESNNFCSNTCSSPNSISAGLNPFANLAAKDYHLISTVGSQYPRNKGTSSGTFFTTDMDNTVFGGDGAWDIGAYEYKSSPNTSTVILSSPVNLRIVNQ
ncbi:MAG: hypothetical protein ACXVCP_14750 [Bdellovibrio sp.]